MSVNRTRFPLLLILILVLYLALGALFAVYTPAWQAPDEPAHYNYARYLVEKGNFPVLHMGDYPHAYLEEIKSRDFPADLSIAPIRYEFHQPPLYYALLAPLYALTGGALLPLRLFSVLLGAGIVLLAYAVARRIFPDRPAVALAAAAFVAFLPQHLATVSQVGNDVLAELLLGLVLYQLIVPNPRNSRFLCKDFGSGGCRLFGSGLSGLGWVLKSAQSAIRNPKPVLSPDEVSEIGNPQSAIILGVLLGLILITKTTAYIAAPLAGAALIWRWWRVRAAGRRIVAELAAVALPAALIALPWYGRDLWAYGWPDFLGLQRHDAIVIGQPRTVDWLIEQGWGGYLQRLVEFTFKSFWGVFGWLGVFMDSRVYFVLAIVSGIAAVGLGLRGAWSVERDGRRQMANGRWQMADGRWQMADGRWQMANGRWQMADGKWQMANGRWQIADGNPVLSPVEGLQIGNPQSAIPNPQSPIFLLATSALLTCLAYAWYNVQFVQHQGRYLFTALIPIAIAFALGWEEALRPRTSRLLAAGLVLLGFGLVAWGMLSGHGLPKWPLALTVLAAAGLAIRPWLPRRLDALLFALPYAALPVLALYALFGAIVPQLSF